MERQGRGAALRERMTSDGKPKEMPRYAPSVQAGRHTSDAGRGPVNANGRSKSPRPISERSGRNPTPPGGNRTHAPRDSRPDRKERIGPSGAQSRQPRASSAESGAVRSEGRNAVNRTENRADAGRRLHTDGAAQHRSTTQRPQEQRRVPSPAGGDRTWTQVGKATGGYVPPQWKDGPRRYTAPPQAGEHRRVPHTSSEALKRQNPSKRREQNRIDQRQNTEQMRRRNRPVRFRVVQKKRISVCRVFRYGMLTILAYAVMMGTLLAFLAGNLIRHAAGGDDTVVLQMGQNSDADRIKRYLKYSVLFPDGEMYLNMTDIALACGWTTTGDMTEIRYLTQSVPPDVIRLTAGSSSAYINGEQVVLAGPVFVKNEMVYIPASFINTYTDGLNVDYDEKKGKITVTRNGTPELSGDMRYDPLTVRMKGPEPSYGIDWDSLDIALQRLIEGEPEEPLPGESEQKEPNESGGTTDE